MAIQGLEMNKKGITDILIVIAFLFAAAILFVVVTKVFSEMDIAIQDSALARSTYGNESWEQTLAVTTNLDMVVLAAFICLVIVALILAALIPADPVFIPVYIIFAIFVVVIAVPLSNVWQDFALDASMSGTVSANYPMADFLLGKLPYIAAALIFIMMIVTYSKGGGGYGR